MAVQVLARVRQTGTTEAATVEELPYEIRTLLQYAIQLHADDQFHANSGVQLGTNVALELLFAYRQARDLVMSGNGPTPKLAGVPFQYKKETPSDTHRVYLFGFPTIYWFVFHYYKSSGKGFMEVREYPQYLQAPLEPAPEPEDDEPFDTEKVLKTSLENLVGVQKAEVILAKQNPDYPLRQQAVGQIISILMYPGQWKIA